MFGLLKNILSVVLIVSSLGTSSVKADCCFPMRTRVFCSILGGMLHLNASNYKDPMCSDCSSAQPFCGVGKCNVFGCNCEGGCRRALAVTLPQILLEKLVRDQFPFPHTKFGHQKIVKESTVPNNETIVTEMPMPEKHTTVTKTPMTDNKTTVTKMPASQTTATQITTPKTSEPADNNNNSNNPSKGPKEKPTNAMMSAVIEEWQVVERDGQTAVIYQIIEADGTYTANKIANNNLP